MTELSVLVALAVLAGRFLDSRLGTSPVFLLLFCLLSFAFSLYRLVGEVGPPRPPSP